MKSLNRSGLAGSRTILLVALLDDDVVTGVECVQYFAQQGTEAAKKPEIPRDFPMTRPGVWWQLGAEEVSRGRA
jgi:hypothetical protein